MAELAPRVEQEEVLGEAKILQTFATKEKHLSEKVVIAGCRVDTGSVKVAEKFRLLRADKLVWSGTCRSMKRLKLEVNQVGKVRLISPFNLTKPGQNLCGHLICNCPYVRY